MLTSALTVFLEKLAGLGREADRGPAIAVAALNRVSEPRAIKGCADLECS
jgi:hypothetical protein